MIRQYGRFASVYDKMMHDVDRNAWVSYLDGFLKNNGAIDVLDCACGTGAMTIRLRKLGYNVIGSDISTEMLFEARNNALNEGVKDIVFIQEDMTKLNLHKPVDAVVSACDGLNYLTSRKDVSSFFKHAALCLKQKGLLLFDISSPYKFRSVLADNTFTEETDDYAYIWKNNFDSKTRLCEMNLTVFLKNGSHYDRFSESHLQRSHSVDELTKSLAEAGFTKVSVYDAFTRDPVRPYSERIQFAAIKE